MTPVGFVLTSESLCDGHPDKVCDGLVDSPHHGMERAKPGEDLRRHEMYSLDEKLGEVLLRLQNAWWLERRKEHRCEGCGAWKGSKEIPHGWITKLDVLIPVLRLAQETVDSASLV